MAKCLCANPSNLLCSSPWPNNDGRDSGLEVPHELSWRLRDYHGCYEPAAWYNYRGLKCFKERKQHQSQCEEWWDKKDLIRSRETSRNSSEGKNVIFHRKEGVLPSPNPVKEGSRGLLTLRTFNTKHWLCAGTATGTIMFCKGYVGNIMNCHQDQ